VGVRHTATDAHGDIRARGSVEDVAVGFGVVRFADADVLRADDPVEGVVAGHPVDPVQVVVAGSAEQPVVAAVAVDDDVPA
jgi:hypothetical protein